MNTDRVKQIGKIEEQIEAEHRSRRNYCRKWLPFYEATPWKEMYNQNEINAQMEKTLKDDASPYVYSNQGDSYFVSPQMYQSLVAVCRCGRTRKGLHLLKCLQNPQNNYLTRDQSKGSNINLSKLPQTSNGFVGWPQRQASDYKKWEDSMKYISPLYDMPHKRITSASYNAIIIG